VLYAACFAVCSANCSTEQWITSGFVLLPESLHSPKKKAGRHVFSHTRLTAATTTVLPPTSQQDCRHKTASNRQTVTIEKTATIHNSANTAATTTTWMQRMITTALSAKDGLQMRVVFNVTLEPKAMLIVPKHIMQESPTECTPTFLLPPVCLTAPWLIFQQMYPR